jgi:glycosyltransferase involved in cell wall biosynthesis
MALSLFIHDYAGHPFQVGLSRALAAKGHQVTHAWFAGDGGPKGVLRRQAGDPEGLHFAPIRLERPYSKTNLFARRSGDRAYGRALAARIRDQSPDIVLSGNTPTEAQAALIPATQGKGGKFLYWCQDFYALAVTALLGRKLPGLGPLVGAWYQHLERQQMRQADHLIHITEDFRPQSEAWGIDPAKTSVIGNWGALADLPCRGRDTGWAKSQNLGPGPRYLYAGTLGMKHNPALLAGLAESVTEGQVITVSAGTGADVLARQAPALPRLTCLPLQPFEQFADVLGAADVLLAVIEREAGVFSVPSKILSYLCAGRPIVLAAPAENRAASQNKADRAGIVVDPEDIAGFIRAARLYGADPVAARTAGANGRAYAEAQFDMDAICTRFETVFTKTLDKG